MSDTRNAITDALLSENLRKEALSIHYVGAVAAACGYVFEVTRVDVYGIDGFVKADFSAFRNSEYHTVQLDLQLKSTAKFTIPPEKEKPISYSLRNKNYWKLSCKKYQNPCLLVALFLPEPIEDSLLQNPNQLCVIGGAYWVNLMGRHNKEDVEELRREAAAKSDKPLDSRTTVHLPQSQLFDVDGLKSIMRKISVDTPIEKI